MTEFIIYEYGNHTKAKPSRRTPDEPRTKLLPFACHRAFYNGKVVAIDYEPNPKLQFRRACQRIADNGADGYVISPDGEIFAVTQASKKARYVSCVFEAQQVLKDAVAAIAKATT